MTKSINNEALSLIKRWEGCKLTAYKDIVGVWTIGYGHTAAAGAPSPKAGMKITQAEADEILKRDLEKYIDAVDAAVKIKINENQRGAMVSLCYNIGPGAFSKSTLVKKLNAGDINGAAEAFLSWKKAGGRVVQGLVNRRNDEKKLFLTPEVLPLAPVAEPAPEVAASQSFLAIIISLLTAMFKGK